MSSMQVQIFFALRRVVGVVVLVLEMPFWLANVGLNHSHVTRRESIFEFMETKKVEM